MTMRKALSLAEAGRYLGFKPAVLRAMREAGIGPPYLRIELDAGSGRAAAIRYLLEDLESWVLSCRVQPADGLRREWMAAGPAADLTGIEAEE